ncbi:hypothetical protein [Streptomyces sp. NPDC004284]|uniref:hypothetical protein n=1 Tax=Streptomyces sp. NPDC004284 TaxID=3364695 RepID=UPI003692E9EA
MHTKPQRSLAAAPALLASGLALLVTGCTAGPPKPVPTPSASASSSTASRASTTPTADPLAERAKSAVSGVSIDEDAFVASGVAPLQDGTRDLSPLTKGKRYEVVVACAGTGAIDVTIGSTPAHTQNCDAYPAPATYRIQSAPAELTFVIRGRTGATGAAAWQIDEEQGP